MQQSRKSWVRRLWKPVLFSLAFGLATGLRADSFGYTNCPASNAVYALPPIAPASQAAWAASTVYASGALIKNAEGVWHCVLPGTSGTNAAVFTGSAGAADGTVTWRRCMTRPRKGMSFTVSGTGDVYLSFPSKAAAGSGTLLAAGGGPYTVTYTGDSVWQGSVSLYSTNVFSVYGQEW